MRKPKNSIRKELGLAILEVFRLIRYLRNYVAIEKSELFVFSFSEIQNLIPKIPVMEIFGRLNAEKLLLEQMNRNRSFLLDDAKRRYVKFKLDFPELQQIIPQYLIAQYLSIKPETLSRIRKKTY